MWKYKIVEMEEKNWPVSDLCNKIIERHNKQLENWLIENWVNKENVKDYTIEFHHSNNTYILKKDSKELAKFIIL